MNENGNVNVNGNGNKHRGSLVWPVMLIGLGVIFLLSNMGVVDWEILPTLIQLWPLLLVAVGLDLLLGRRSGIWAGITVAIVLAMFAGGVWLVQTTSNVWTGEISTHEIYQSLGDASEADVRINMGVGVLRIDSLSSEDALISGSIQIGQNEKVRESLENSGSTAVYRLNTTGQEYYPSWLFQQGWNQDKKWELALNDAIPLNLDLECGVGSSTIDASGLMLQDLTLNNGVGETTLYLPASGEYSVSIDGGVGQVTVYIPKDLGVRMRLDTGLGNTSISGDFSMRNGYYTTDNYESSENRVDIFISSGVGQIVVIQQD